MKIDKAIIGIIIFLIIYIMLLFNPSKDTIGLTIMMTVVILLVLTPIIIIIRNDRKREKEFLKEFEEMKENSERYTVLKVTKTKKRIAPKGIKIIIQGFAVLLIILIFQIKQIFNLNKENIMEFVILLIPTAILALLLYACIKKMKQENITTYTYPKYTFYGSPYETVLTPKELEFYNMLKPITDKYNMLIFSKGD